MTTSRDDSVLFAVDESRCCGHGRCYGMYPDFFEPEDDEGHAAVVENARNRTVIGASLASEIANVCPERAILTQPTC
jgi:ferredoxin